MNSKASKSIYKLTAAEYSCSKHFSVNVESLRTVRGSILDCFLSSFACLWLFYNIHSVWSCDLPVYLSVKNWLTMVQIVSRYKYDCYTSVDFSEKNRKDLGNLSKSEEMAAAHWFRKAITNGKQVILHQPKTGNRSGVKNSRRLVDPFSEWLKAIDY